ncbi:MAG: hypothetical protein WCP21_17940 [Armatimonadota bacterium]
MGLVYGTLYKKSNNAPMPSTLMTFTRPGTPPTVVTTTTDVNGNYSLSLTTGQWTVTAVVDDVCTPAPLNVPSGSLYRNIINTEKIAGNPPPARRIKAPEPPPGTEIHWYWPDVDANGEVIVPRTTIPSVVKNVPDIYRYAWVHCSGGKQKDNLDGKPEVTKLDHDLVLVVWCLKPASNPAPDAELKAWGWHKLTATPDFRKAVAKKAVAKAPAKKAAPKKK